VTLSGPGVNLLTESRNINGEKWIGDNSEVYSEDDGILLYLPRLKDPSFYA